MPGGVILEEEISQPEAAVIIAASSAPYPQSNSAGAAHSGQLTHRRTA
ncbi:MAG: hypothetical protein R3C68_05610 [Myxococcota bacterium]